MDLVALTGGLARNSIRRDGGLALRPSLIVVAVMQLPERLRLKFMVSGLVCVTLIILLPMARDAAVIEIIGAAYFTLGMCMCLRLVKWTA